MEKISIGRAPENNLVFDSPIISGFHATITIDDQGQATFEDHSTNGTLINGQKLHRQACIIQPTDCIQLAGSVPLDLSFLNDYTSDVCQEYAPADTSYHPEPEPEYQPKPTNAYTPQSEYQPQPAGAYNPKPEPPMHRDDFPPDSTIHENVWAQTDQQNHGSQAGPYSQTPLPSVSMGKALSNLFSNYANFSGRARRSEYWWVVLANCLIGLIPFVNVIWFLVILIPCLALSVRRLHDTGKSGWLFLLCLIPLIGGIILLVWYCQDGQPFRNQYGDSPKYKG